ncbi:MAG: hypothetical protein K2L12_07630 [Clostridia bacterium]|nr:hypothetical protein [Clostridia bacterium]
MKALDGLSAQNNVQNGAQSTPQQPSAQPAPAAAPPYQDTPNVMASVLARHEQISNRVRNKR